MGDAWEMDWRYMKVYGGMSREGLRCCTTSKLLSLMGSASADAAMNSARVRPRSRFTFAKNSANHMLKCETTRVFLPLSFISTMELAPTEVLNIAKSVKYIYL